LSEDDLDKDPRLKKAEFIIFASKHASTNKKKTLALHAPGNWKNADYGGKPGKLCPTSCQALKFLFQSLEKNNTLDYEVTLEATHHGPLISKPCCFIEVGSTETEWADIGACKVVAKTIADFQNFKKTKSKNTIAIGSGHYAPNFTKIQLSGDIAIGHILPEYHFPANAAMIKEALEKTHEHVDLILIDWKGCGNSGTRQKLIDLIESLGLPWERTDRVKK
jgi:Uncharacterized protein conserved in archaea